MPVSGQTYQDNLILSINVDSGPAMKNMAAFEQYLQTFGNTVQDANKAQAQGAVAANKTASATDKQAKSTQKATKAGHEHADSLMSQSHSFRRLSGNISTGSLALDVFSMRLDRASMFMWRFNIAMIPLQQIQFQLMAVTAAMGMLEVAAINTYRAVDRMQNTFMGMGDSAAEAGDKVDFLLEKAKTLPFTFQQVSQAAMAFKTSGIAETEEELDKWINSAADLAAAASTEQGRDIGRAAEAMVDAVNGEIRRLRNTYHVSSEEIAKYGEDASDALHALISDKWGGTAEKQMQSLEGSISNFMDSLTRLGVAFGENLKEPLMVFLGIGQDVVEMLTTIAKWAGTMGGGWVVIAATAIPAMGAMAAAVTRIWMQIQGLRGGYKILTRDMGSLFNVIARLTAAMNDLAVAEANELAVMEGSELSIKEQIAERNRLIATLEAQGAATAGLTSRVAAHRAGADVDIAQKWHSGVMRRAHAPMMPGGSGAATVANLSTVEKRLLAIGNAAKETTIPMGMYQKYLDSQGKSLGMLTKAEHVYMLEESKRLGILGVSAVQTSRNTAAEGALTAARKAQMTAIGEQILLQQRMARFSVGNMLGYTQRKGLQGASFLSSLGSQAAWNKRFETIGTGMRKVRLAMHTTTGALLTTAAAGLAIYGSVKKVQDGFREASDEIDSFVENQKEALDRRVEEGDILERDAVVAKQRIDALEEELKHKTRLHDMIAVYQALGIVTFGITTAVGHLIKEFSGLGDEIAALEGEITDLGDRRDWYTNINSAFERSDGTVMDGKSFMGRRVSREEAIAAADRLHGSGRTARPKRLHEIQARMQEMQVREDESGITPADQEEMNELRLEEQEILKEIAKDRAIVAVAMENEAKLREAEEAQLRAVNEQRQIEIDILQKEQNLADSRLGYLRATHAAATAIAPALEEQAKVHDELAAKYKASGDMAKYYQHHTAAAQAREQAATVIIEEKIRKMDLEEQRMRATGASEVEMFEIRQKHVDALIEEADALESVGNVEEAERKRIEALTKARESYIAVIQEEIDQHQGLVSFLEATHAKAGPVADELRKVAAAQEKMAMEALDAGDESGYWAARAAAAQARERAQLLPAQEELQDAQNVLGARTSLGSSVEDVNAAIEEENRALAKLALQYSIVGDEQKEWETNLKILENEQKMLISTHEKHIEGLEREYEWTEANNASADELHQMRLQQADALEDYANALERVGRVEEAEAKRHEARMKRLKDEKDHYSELNAEMNAYADRAEIMSSRDDNKLLDPAVYNAKMRAAQAELKAAKATGKKSDVLNAENKILELRKQRAEQAEDARAQELKDIASIQKAVAEQYAQRAGGNADTSLTVFGARLSALRSEQQALDPKDEASHIEMATKYMSLIEQTAEARKDEQMAIAQSRYELAKELEEQDKVSKGYVNLYKNRVISLLQERIRNEDVLSEKIRLQTDLIKLQADEASDGYDNIVRRILGGADVVEEAISSAQLATRFGPDAIRGAGITSSAAVRVVGSDRSTLTIEIGKGSINRLKDALSGAAADAFTRSFIEDLVKRVR